MMFFTGIIMYLLGCLLENIGGANHRIDDKRW